MLHVSTQSLNICSDAANDSAYAVLRHTRHREVAWHRRTGSIFVDSCYVTRGVPGIILWILLTENQRTGRVDFSNRALRADSRLSLPLKDNLDVRLIYLRERLQDSPAGVRIEKTGRGTFRLILNGSFQLREAD